MFVFIFIDFVIGSLEFIVGSIIIKITQWVFAKINAWEIWEIILWSFCFSFQIIYYERNNTDNFCQYRKLWPTLVFFKGFVYSYLIKNLLELWLEPSTSISQMLKNVKINSRSHLIPTISVLRALLL